MAIPSSPSEISLGQLRVEFVNGDTDDYALRRVGRPTSSGFAGATDPPLFTPVNQNSPVIPDNVEEFAMSEWYDYDHSAYGFCSITKFTTPDIGRFFTYYKIQVTGDPNTFVRVNVEPLGPSNILTYVNVYANRYPFNADGSLIPEAPDLKLLTAGTTVQSVYSRDTADPEYLHIVIFDASAAVYSDVYINSCASQYTSSAGELSISLRSTQFPGYVGGTSVPVLAAVAILVNVWIGSSYYTEYLTMPTGSSFASAIMTNVPPNSFVANVDIAEITPTGFSSHEYKAGDSVIGFC